MITNLLIISDEIHLRTGTYFVKFILIILQVAWVLTTLRLTNHLSLTCNSNDITQDTSEKFLVSIWVNDKNDSTHVVESELEIFW